MINPSDIRLDSLPWVPLNATNGFPEQPAVYFAIDSQNQIQYIGRSGNVRVRWKNHHRYEELAAIGGVKVVYLFVEVPELLPEIEAALIDWFDPPLNKKVGRKPKTEGTSVINVRTSSQASATLKNLALKCGYIYNDEGATGALLDAIAQLASTENGRLILIGLLRKSELH